MSIFQKPLSFYVFILTLGSLFFYAFLGLPLWTSIGNEFIRGFLLFWFHITGLLWWPFVKIIEDS